MTASLTDALTYYRRMAKEARAADDPDTADAWTRLADEVEVYLADLNVVHADVDLWADQ